MGQHPPFWRRAAPSESYDTEDEVALAPPPRLAPRPAPPPPTLSAKATVWLAECEAAVHENKTLREQLSQTTEDLRVAQRLIADIEDRANLMLEDAADKLDALEDQNGKLFRQNIAYRERLLMFGDASSKIIQDITKGEPEQFAPRNRKPHQATPEQPVRPVRAVDPEGERSTGLRLLETLGNDLGEMPVVRRKPMYG